MENKTNNRIFMLGDQVTQSSVSSVIKSIWEINLEDAEKETKIVNFERSPIHLILNTYGGNVYDGLALIGAIESSETPVYITVVGSAMSMGLIILCAGHYRRMHVYSTLMYHQISTVSIDKLEGIKKDLVESDRLEKICENILTRRTKLTTKDLENHKKTKSEWYIDAETAAKYGIIDEIVAGTLGSEDLQKIQKSLEPKRSRTSRKTPIRVQKKPKG